MLGRSFALLAHLSDRPEGDKLEQLLHALLGQQGDELAFVVLFGSMARGDWSLGSDYDVLIGLRTATVNALSTVWERLRPWQREIARFSRIATRSGNICGVPDIPYCSKPSRMASCSGTEERLQPCVRIFATWVPAVPSGTGALAGSSTIPQSPELLVPCASIFSRHTIPYHGTYG